MLGWWAAAKREVLKHSCVDPRLLYMLMHSYVPLTPKLPPSAPPLMEKLEI